LTKKYLKPTFKEKIKFAVKLLINPKSFNILKIYMK
jgi:hypothetical protein